MPSLPSNRQTHVRAYRTHSTPLGEHASADAALFTSWHRQAQPARPAPRERETCLAPELSPNLAAQQSQSASSFDASPMTRSDLH